MATSSSWLNNLDPEAIKADVRRLRTELGQLDQRREELLAELELAERVLDLRGQAIEPAAASEPRMVSEIRRSPTAGLTRSVLGVVASEPQRVWHAEEIAKALSGQFQRNSVLSALSRLAADNQIVRVSRGNYRLPQDEASPTQSGSGP